MNRIRKKLASDRGASITFALLLFLVCAVLCSVIITAASTASGRMANLAETDRRYYAVTSAAELLKSLIDGQTVSVVKVETETFTTTYNDGEAVSSDTPTEKTELYVIKGKATPGTELGTAIGDSPVFESIPEDAAYRVYNAGTGTPSGRTLNLKSDFSGTVGATFDAYAAEVKEEFDEDGNMTLTVYNKYNGKGDAGDAGSRYTLVLTCKLGNSEDTYSKSVEKNNNDSHSSGGVVINTSTTTTTKTTISTYTWKLTDIKTGSAS